MTQMTNPSRYSRSRRTKPVGRKEEEHDLARDQEPGVLGELGRVRDEIHAIL